MSVKTMRRWIKHLICTALLQYKLYRPYHFDFHICCSDLHVESPNQIIAAQSLFRPLPTSYHIDCSLRSAGDPASQPVATFYTVPSFSPQMQNFTDVWLFLYSHASIVKISRLAPLCNIQGSCLSLQLPRAQVGCLGWQFAQHNTPRPQWLREATQAAHGLPTDIPAGLRLLLAWHISQMEAGQQRSELEHAFRLVFGYENNIPMSTIMPWLLADVPVGPVTCSLPTLPPFPVSHNKLTFATALQI